MPLDYLDHLRRESARFGAVLRDADLAAPVPTCPDWTAADLLYHLAEAFLFWAIVVRERADDPDPIDAAKPAQLDDRDELFALYENSTAVLLDALAGTPDDVAVWTWSSDNTVGFVRRRMPHEALIHRLDAELTAGALSDVDPALATDGVAEALEHFHGGAPAWSELALDGPVGRARATDTGAEWLFRFGGFSGVSPNTGKTYDREPTLLLAGSGDPSFTISAPARDLDAWMWNRPQVGEVRVDGNQDDFARLTAIVAACM